MAIKQPITPEQLAAWKALAEKPHEIVRSNGTARELDVALFKLGNESRQALPALIAEVERLTEALQGIADGACGAGYDECDQACADIAQEALGDRYMPPAPSEPRPKSANDNGWTQFPGGIAQGDPLVRHRVESFLRYARNEKEE